MSAGGVAHAMRHAVPWPVVSASMCNLALRSAHNMNMRVPNMLLCALLAAAGLAARPVRAQGCATIKDFIETNSDLYAYMSEAYPSE